MLQNALLMLLQPRDNIFFALLIRAVAQNHAIKHVEMRPVATKHHVIDDLREMFLNHATIMLPCINQILASTRCGVRRDGSFRMPIEVARRGINRHFIHFREEINNGPGILVRHAHRLRHLVKQPRRI